MATDAERRAREVRERLLADDDREPEHVFDRGLFTNLGTAPSRVLTPPEREEARDTDTERPSGTADAGEQTSPSQTGDGAVPTRERLAARYRELAEERTARGDRRPPTRGDVFRSFGLDVPPPLAPRELAQTDVGSPASGELERTTAEERPARGTPRGPRAPIPAGAPVLELAAPVLTRERPRARRAGPRPDDGSAHEGEGSSLRVKAGFLVGEPHLQVIRRAVADSGRRHSEIVDEMLCNYFGHIGLRGREDIVEERVRIPRGRRWLGRKVMRTYALGAHTNETLRLLKVLYEVDRSQVLRLALEHAGARGGELLR